jgi:aspartate/glutamate/aspartate-prephenate aminotransferase
MNAIRDGSTRYTPNAGTMELRKAICNKLQGVCVRVDEFLVCRVFRLDIGSLID